MPETSNNPFRDTDSAQVYARVLTNLDATERSLWRRVESELKKSGIPGVDSYLRSAFCAVSEEIDERLTAFKEASSK